VNKFCSIFEERQHGKGSLNERRSEREQAREIVEERKPKRAHDYPALREVARNIRGFMITTDSEGLLEPTLLLFEPLSSLSPPDISFRLFESVI